MGKYILQAVNIQKKYNGSEVLCGLNFRLEKGEIYGLVGQNGSGKTTLLRILTGQIQRYSGSVTAQADAPIKLSSIINSPALFLNLSAVQNMRVHALALGMRDDARIKETLETVGLSRYDKKPTANFSLGMKQRLKLALALLETPDILILDEPVNGLDPSGIAELRKLLLHLNSSFGITIIVSSHILLELEQVATTFGILHSGVIVKEVKTADSKSGKNLEELYMQYTGGGQAV